MTTKNAKNEAARAATAHIAAELAAIKSLVTPLDKLIMEAHEAGKADANAKDSPLTIGKKIYANTKFNALKPGDVRNMYLAYADGQNEAGYGTKVDLTNKDVVKVGVSNFMKFHKLASLPGNRHYFTLIDTAREAISAHLSKTTKVKPGASHYTRILKVLTEQNKRGDAPIMSAKEVIETVFPAKEDKSVVEQLTELGKAAQRGIDANPTASWYFAQVLATVNEMVKKVKAGTPTPAVEEVEEEEIEEVEEEEIEEVEEAEDENENELENMLAA